MIHRYCAWLYNVFVSGILRNAGFFFFLDMLAWFWLTVLTREICAAALNWTHSLKQSHHTGFQHLQVGCTCVVFMLWITEFWCVLYIDSFWRNMTVPAPSLDSSLCLSWRSHVILTFAPHEVSAVAAVAEVHTCLLGLPPSSLPQLPHLCSQRQSKHCETAKWNLSTLT